MDRYSRSAFAKIEDENEDGVASAAESVCSDFAELIQVFDQQLARLSDASKRERAHIADARAAAERGLRLSQQLSNMLRTST